LCMVTSCRHKKAPDRVIRGWAYLS
jgi:hypothetical protein